MEFEQHFAPLHGVAGTTVQTTPAEADTGSSLRARPAPRRQAALPTCRASSRLRTPSAVAVTVSRWGATGEGRIRVAALGPDHRRHTSMARPSAQHVGRVDGVASPAQLAASPGQGDGELDDVGRPAPGQHLDRLGAPPGRCRRSARAGCPCRSAAPRCARPSARPAPPWSRASSRARSTSCMNAPEPTFTSSTRAPVPSAIFLLMIELAISGIGLDRAGDVAQRVELAVGRRQVRPRPRRSPRRPRAAGVSISALLSDARQPGIDSSLSSVPPVCPSPRPDSCGTAAPHAATSGAERERDLVADAAGGVLVDRGPVQADESPAARRWRSWPCVHRADLGAIHALEQRWPSPGRSSARRPRCPGVGVDEPVDLGVGQGAAGRAWRG